MWSTGAVGQIEVEVAEGRFRFRYLLFLSAPTPSEAALGLRRPGERAHTQHHSRGECDYGPQLPPLVLSLSLSCLFFFSRVGLVGYLSRLPTLTLGRRALADLFAPRHPRADLPRPRIGAAAPRDRQVHGGSLARMQPDCPPARTHARRLRRSFAVCARGDLNARNYATGAAQVGDSP
jgi:hypothetical protein